MPTKTISFRTDYIPARPVHRGLDRRFDHAGTNCPALR